MLSFDCSQPHCPGIPCTRPAQHCARWSVAAGGWTYCFFERYMVEGSTIFTTPHQFQPNTNKFIRILNGSVLRHFRKVDFNMTMSRVNPSVVGQRWNSQYTWGIASMDFRWTNPDEMVTHPTIKSANVSDGILRQFVVLSGLLLEIDKDGWSHGESYICNSCFMRTPFSLQVSDQAHCCINSM